MGALQGDWYLARVPSIAQNIRRLRKKAELSQTQLAKAAGVSQQLISQLERGENQSTKELPDIAGALGCQVHEIDESYRQGATAMVAVPLISWVSAGALLQPDMPVPIDEAPVMLEPDLDPNGDWIALRVDGDSMDKVAPHNYVIFVNRKERRLVRGGLYVIGDGEGGATFKQFDPPNTWRPLSHNPEHKPFKSKPNHDPDIIGRVRKAVSKF